MQWGLATLVFVLVCAVILLVADVPQPSTLERAFVAGLAAFAGWAAVSAAWSPGAAAPVLEAERVFLYVAAAGAAVLVLAAGAAPEALLGGIVAGTVLLAIDGLAAGGERLAEPIGYSNALGILAAVGTLLALGFAAHDRVAVRAAAGVAPAVLLPTLYLTFSRGATVALAAGAVFLALLHPRRPRLIAWALLLAGPAALGVVLVSQGARAGRDLALAVLGTAILAVVVAFAAAGVERRIRLPARAGDVLVVAAAIGVLACGAAVAAAVAERAADGTPADPEDRLLSADSSYRTDYWRVAWRMVRAEPLSGGGVGAWEAHWLRERPIAFDTRDAHNLYLETLAELGPVGLALLLATFSLPFRALPRARHTAGGPAAAATLAALLVHAGLDWDWEIPAVVVPALVCSAILLATTRSAGSSALTARRRGVALALAVPVLAVALVAHVGNGAAHASESAAARGDAHGALESARRAIAWAPWSEQAWELRGEAELLLGDDAAARRSLRRALELNDQSWSAWLDLAVASEGEARSQALERVDALNPLSADADEVRAALRTKP